jgi:hypothetical protein
MTRFGKLLVFMQVAISLMMLTTALVLYAYRVNWSPRQSFFGGEPVPGLIDGDINGKVPGRLDELLTSLVDLRDQSENHWQSAYANFKHVDDQRLAYLDWYEDQTRLANTGKNRANKVIDPPVRVLVRGADGLLDMDDQREPVTTTGKIVVKSIEAYKDRYEEVKAQISHEQKALDDLAEKLKEITEEIAGIPGKTPGLRGQLLSEITFHRLHQDEMAYLRPQLNARRVESQVLERRLQYLQERRKELYAALGIDPE